MPAWYAGQIVPRLYLVTSWRMRLTNTLLAELASVVEAAITFKDKVERDAPKCFQPSKELANLFDTIDLFQKETTSAKGLD